MPQQSSSVENNFIGGLKTEFTALNFPENACTDADNCDFTTIGDVVRRAGIDLEANYTANAISRNSSAITSFRWENVGGDGTTKILVTQVGATLRFWQYSAATTSSPISSHLLSSTVNLNLFTPAGAPIPSLYECQYAEGNGYLFVFHPYLEPFYCSYSGGVVTANQITLQVRDFNGVPEPGVSVTLRPSTLEDIHKYNLNNQGWTSAPPWVGNATDSVIISTGSHSFNIASGLTIPLGTPVRIYSTQGAGISNAPPDGLYMSGSVTAYAGTLLTVNVTFAYIPFIGTAFNSWIISPSFSGFISTWQGAVGNYPANADVWWKFKNSSGAFDPGTTAANITLNSGNAPRGHYILKAFQQQRTSISGVSNVTDVVTATRPKTGTWFQGRVWYAGTDASIPASGTTPFYTWTESIYFSQVAVNADQFGMAYQTNDPTGEDFFDLLPTDGGVIQIQGCGSVHKLFPIQNGLLVFASNGIWFITGSQGSGFTANDYTILKISSVRALSGSSFVSVNGVPVFWNEEGIYNVTVSQQGDRQGGLIVNSLTYSTIGSFYETIPLSSKMHAKGDYDPIGFRVSWLFKDTEETSVDNRYEYNRQLNLNTNTQAFFPYSINAVSPVLNDIKFIYGVSGASAPTPAFKYLTSYVTTNSFMTFSEEHDYTNWVDFHSINSTDYTSYFVTGYKLHGKALVKWQPVYFNFFSRASTPTAYRIQGIWDYANDGNSGRYSNIQMVTNALSRFNMIYRKHKIRGRGLSLQLKVTSVDGMPFDIMGWSSIEMQNTGM